SSASWWSRRRWPRSARAVCNRAALAEGARRFPQPQTQQAAKTGGAAAFARSQGLGGAFKCAVLRMARNAAQKPREIAASLGRRVALEQIRRPGQILAQRE